MRIVIKVGTGVLMGRKGGLDHRVLEHLVTQLTRLFKQGHQVLLVSSGAVGAGSEIVTLKKVDEVVRKKMLAAVGQARLIRLYREAFDKADIRVAQILLLRDDFNDRRKYLSIRTILEQLMAHRIIPILNENDVLSVSDLCFSDNDNLAALAAVALKADHLILLSDVDGLYTGNPGKDKKAKRLPVIRAITPQIKAHASESVSAYGLGGMINKVLAAEIATRAGIEAHICLGRRRDVIAKCFTGQHPGTRFIPKKGSRATRYMGKKAWLGVGVVPNGGVVVDTGALQALKNHKSLLAVGIRAVQGDFKTGDVVTVFDEHQVPHGTGMIRYGSSRLRKLEIVKDRANVARTHFKKPVIHVDELVIW